MKKKVILISILFVILSFIIIISFSKENRDFKVMSNINKDKQIINSNMLTLMYETESGSGIYEETKDTNWPASGYIFNETLSGCENGGELEYNSQNNTVNLLSNKSDKCYVYFDKYDGVWIDDVIITNVTGSSVTLSVSATSENGSISKYYYSINDSEEYIEASSNVITISDLNKLTEYKISIYCLDSTNAKSNIYEVKVSTTDESKPVINSVEVSNITDSGFTLTVNATSDVEISKYYFTIDGNGENNAGTSTTNTFTFNTLNDNTNYSLLIIVEDINGAYSQKYNINAKTEKKKPLLADYIKGLYISQGANGLYYHMSSLANSAADNSYRYAGANPNNYVCFGSDTTTCPSDNLYRIIGVFGSEVKLIKSTSYGSYAWDSGSSNTWNANTKPDIRSTLNTIFLNTLSITWQNKIATHSWEVGGMAFDDSATAREYYDTEIRNQTGYADTMKIGLMYVSDYGFAASNSHWTTELYKYKPTKSSNWLAGLSELTISRRSNSNNYAFRVYSSGYVDANGNSVASSAAVRPCFYLTSDTLYSSGSGTSTDPIRLVI